MTVTLPPLLDSVLGGGTPGRSCIRVLMDPMLRFPKARKLIVPQQTPTYAQVAKSSTISATTQTDEKNHKNNMSAFAMPETRILCKSITQYIALNTTISTSSSSNQTQLLPSTSSVTITLSSESQPPIPLTNSAPAISTSLSTPATSSSSTPSVILLTLVIEWKNYQLKSSHLSLCLILHLPHPLVNHLFQKL
ncbi:hypothetical protein TNCV_2413711 [Trichonephila clavipes]|nr:hypothetical protein TNCV_2413711 [Trichonephila clavipes]